MSDVAAEGFGFAIPIDMATEVADDLIESGTVNHALLGINGGDLLRRGIRGRVSGRGPRRRSDAPTTPTRQRGGQVNDVIVALDGVPIDTLERLLTELRRHRAGEESIVGITRSDGDLDLTVTLGKYEP